MYSATYCEVRSFISKKLLSDFVTAYRNDFADAIDWVLDIQEL
jgi:hypothetical protein